MKTGCWESEQRACARFRFNTCFSLFMFGVEALRLAPATAPATKTTQYFDATALRVACGVCCVVSEISASRTYVRSTSIDPSPTEAGCAMSVLRTHAGRRRAPVSPFPPAFRPARTTAAGFICRAADIRSGKACLLLGVRHCSGEVRRRSPAVPPLFEDLLF